MRNSPKKPHVRQLKAGKELAAYRDTLLEEQGWVCALCGQPILPTDRVHMDHAHKGPNIHHCRGVLHAGCNILQGKIENAVTLNRISPERLAGIFARYQEYVDADYTDNHLYPKKKRTKKKPLRP